MCPDKRVHLEVALEPDEGTIRGSVGDGAGTVVEFTGWLELMSTFDSARAQAAAACDGTGDTVNPTESE